jgi:metal-responsive CopG/Arc/MetJ family transcriptional regulator
MSLERICLTLPKELLDQVDRQRQDIPRSRFIRRILKNAVQDFIKNNDEEKNQGAITPQEEAPQTGNVRGARAR